MNTPSPVFPVDASVYSRCAWPKEFPVALQAPGAVFDVYVHESMEGRGLLDVFVTARGGEQFVAAMETGSRTWLMIHALAAGAPGGFRVDPSAYGHRMAAVAELKAEQNATETEVLARGKRSGTLYSIRRPVRSPEFVAAVASIVEQLERMSAVDQAEAVVVQAEARLRTKPAPVRTCEAERMNRGTAILLSLGSAGVAIVFMAAVFGLL